MGAPSDTVPNGSDLLIDTNVFVYGLSGSSPQCKECLRRCSIEQVTGITLYEVIHEATHKFMLAEGRSKNLFVRQGASYLSAHPEQVKRLTDYWVNTQRLLALNLVFLPMEEKIVIEAQKERFAAGLMTNEAIIIAAMHEYGISNIATADAAFNAVAGISVFSPTDLQVA